MIRLVLAIIVASGLLLACSPKPDSPIKEGSIHYKITYTGNLGTAASELPNGLIIHFKNNLLRLEMEGGLGQLKPAVLINGEKGEITTLKTAEHTAEIRHLLAKDTSLVDSKTTENMAGHPCRIYKATNRNTRYQIWAATDMPFTMNGTSRLEGFYLSNYSGLPLKIIDNEQDFTITFRADTISSQAQPDSLFKYEVVK